MTVSEHTLVCKLIGYNSNHDGGFFCFIMTHGNADMVINTVCKQNNTDWF